MFDAIGVSERTREAVDGGGFIGWPDGHGRAWPFWFRWWAPTRCRTDLSVVTVPEPPRALPHRPAPAATKHVSVVPSAVHPKGLVLPTAIPQKAVMIQDPDFMPRRWRRCRH